MKRVLLLSHTTGYQLRAFNDAAEALGIELVFATDRCHRLDDPWQDRAIPVRFHDARARRSTRSSRARAGSPIDGVIAVGDRPVVLAARAAAALGLPLAFGRRRRGEHRQAPLAGRARCGRPAVAALRRRCTSHEMARIRRRR